LESSMEDKEIEIWAAGAVSCKVGDTCKMCVATW
jgi:hypothetical protein